MNNDSALLDHFTAPMQEYFNDPTVTEICINRPKELWIQKNGVFTSRQVPEFDSNFTKELGPLIADHSEQKIKKDTPILSASLPSGFRVQALIAPATKMDHVVIAIRKQITKHLTLDDYDKAGSFNFINYGNDENNDDKIILELYQQEYFMEFLKELIIRKKTILISGSTGCGKTTFMNACLKYIPMDERLVTIQDAAELLLEHENVAELYYSRGGQSISKHTPDDLIQAAMRLSPDRIIFGELRGVEAYSFMEAINTDHPGSITSVHANSPSMAIKRVGSMILRAKLGYTQQEIENYLRSIIDAVIQLGVTIVDGKRLHYVKGVYYAGAG